MVRLFARYRPVPFRHFYHISALLSLQRFCMINRKYQDPFEQIFRDSYDTIHRLESNKLRNVACLFSHLLHTDAISWGVLTHIRLTEEDTTSSSRIFIKILFQELSEYMGLPRLNERIKDPYVACEGGGEGGDGERK